MLSPRILANGIYKDVALEGLRPNWPRCVRPALVRTAPHAEGQTSAIQIQAIDRAGGPGKPGVGKKIALLNSRPSATSGKKIQTAASEQGDDVAIVSCRVEQAGNLNGSHAR